MYKFVARPRTNSVLATHFLRAAGAQKAGMVNSNTTVVASGPSAGSSARTAARNIAWQNMQNPAYSRTKLQNQTHLPYEVSPETSSTRYAHITAVENYMFDLPGSLRRDIIGGILPDAQPVTASFKEAVVLKLSFHVPATKDPAAITKELEAHNITTLKPVLKRLQVITSESDAAREIREAADKKKINVLHPLSNTDSTEVKAEKENYRAALVFTEEERLVLVPKDSAQWPEGHAMATNTVKPFGSGSGVNKSNDWHIFSQDPRAGDVTCILTLRPMLGPDGVVRNRPCTIGGLNPGDALKTKAGLTGFGDKELDEEALALNIHLYAEGSKAPPSSIPEMVVAVPPQVLAALTQANVLEPKTNRLLINLKDSTEHDYLEALAQLVKTRAAKSQDDAISILTSLKEANAAYQRKLEQDSSFDAHFKTVAHIMKHREVSDPTLQDGDSRNNQECVAGAYRYTVLLTHAQMESFQVKFGDDAAKALKPTTDYNRPADGITVDPSHPFVPGKVNLEAAGRTQWAFNDVHRRQHAVTFVEALEKTMNLVADTQANSSYDLEGKATLFLTPTMKGMIEATLINPNPDSEEGRHLQQFLGFAEKLSRKFIPAAW